MGYSLIKSMDTDVETTFGTDPAASRRAQASLIEGSVKMRTPIKKLPDLSTVQRLHDRNHHVSASQFGCGFTSSHYLTGLSAALVDAGSFTSPGTDFGEILLAGFGGLSGFAGDKIFGTSSTTVQVFVDDESLFPPGHAFCIQNAVTSRYEIRSVISTAANTLNLRSALGNAPTTDDYPVYNCATFYLDEDNVGGDTDSLTCRFIGYAATDQWIFTGCVPQKFTFKTPLDDFLICDVDMAAATWANTSGLTAGSTTLAGSRKVVCSLGSFAFISEGSTTHNRISCHEISIDPGLSLMPERAFDGTETVVRFRQMRSKPTVSMTVRAFRGSFGGSTFETFWTDADSETAYREGMFVAGSSPVIAGSGTGMVAIETPRMQYAAEPELVDEGDGFQDVKLTFDCDEDGVATPASDLARSAVRVHLF